MLQATGYITESRPKIYGVEFKSYAEGIANGSNEELSTKGIRLYDSVGYRFVRGSEDTTETDSFTQNNAAPFAIKECITEYDSTSKTQRIINYSTDSNYAARLATGNYNVMIEFPLFYYCRPSKYELRASEDLINGYLPSPMHYRNGTIYSKVLVTKYAVDSSYMSRSGQTPLTNTDISTMRTALANKGMYLMDYNTYMSLMMLMLIKYANLNVQSVIGNGTYGADSIPTNGACDNVLGKDGGNGLKSSTSSVVTLGIENLYGKLHHYIDGINYSASGFYINEDIESHADTSSYVLADNALTNDLTNKNVKELAYKETYPWSLHPILASSGTPSIESILSGGPFSMLFNNTQSESTGALGFCFPLNVEVISKNTVISSTDE